MFNCDYCGKSVTEKTKPINIVEEKRFRSYQEHKSFGFEVVREKKACQECVDSGIAVSAPDPTRPKFESWNKGNANRFRK